MELPREREETGPKFANARTIEQAIGHAAYQRACLEYRSFLSRGRAVRDDPQELLGLQADLAERLLGLEAAQREQKKMIKNNHLSAEELEAANLKLSVARRLAHVIREIADGIAWRFFYYDRAGLYQLSRKPQVGHLDEANINHEMARAETHVAEGTLVLINDLTNFVRFGDLTLRMEDGFKIIEVKGGGGSASSGHATRQQRKLSEMADFINSGSRRASAGNEQLRRLKTIPRTHLAAVKALITEARQTGCASDRLSDCLAVVVRDLTHGRAVKSSRTIDFNPFSQSRKWLAGNSLAGFDYFTPNRAPYSIFPWSDADCTDVLAGRIWIVSYLSWGKLERVLKRRGLIIHGDLDHSRLIEFMGLPFEDRKARSFDIALSVGRPNSGSIRIAFPEFMRLAYEFLDEESFADAMEELVEVGIPPEEIHFTAFEHGNEIWD